jgi:hypothetical protein
MFALHYVRGRVVVDVQVGEANPYETVSQRYSPHQPRCRGVRGPLLSCRTGSPLLEMKDLGLVSASATIQDSLAGIIR